MQVPKINPDEFGPGYLIRLGLVNGLYKQKDVLKRILHDYPNKIEHRPLASYLLSVVLGQSPEYYCQQHTLLPIYRSFSNNELNLDHGSIEYEYGLIRYGHLAQIKYFKVCKSCIEEDLSYLNYSYYRRSHQIPGVRCCSKHGSSESGRLYSVPLESFCNPDQIEGAQLIALQQYENQYIDRILSIMDGLCMFKRPIDPNSLIAIMQSRAKALGFRWINSGEKELLSDAVINRIPSEWLEDLGICLDSKVKGRRSGSIDGALSVQKAPAQALVYVTVLALLFDDSDQVLTLIKNIKELPIQKVKTLRKFDQTYWETDEFFRLYLNKGGNASELAKHFGVSESVIWKGLKIAKLPTIGLYKDSVFRALELFQSGYSLEMSSTRSGVPIDKLEAVMRVAISKFSAFINPSDKNQEFLHLETLEIH